jgi:prepilin-type N-terminal cleavage/methylation domain-containing protein
MKNGFTLIELSIVLVIIGLIIGGVTVGQDLIRSAELQSFVSNINQYKVAVNTFKLKYNALPGDINKAQSYWPSCVDNIALANTCNGDGDGAIEIMNEGARSFQHLYLAGLGNEYQGRQIDGDFDGDNWPTYFNRPSTLFQPTSFPHKDGSFYRVSSHSLSLGSFNDINLQESEYGMIDTKQDDGKPFSGKYKVTVFGTNCLTPIQPYEYDYTNSGSGNVCSPVIELDF